ncbi:hypothetical protein EI998_08535 [Streptococcus suis]|uniref:Uncharacterized protein n=1 Tax=Streptococcus suis TaxID=1307 RepID=A0A3R8R6I8_STRSU|nr:hypothetical protein EI998_08535 [Streptococcus suis]
MTSRRRFLTHNHKQVGLVPTCFLVRRACRTSEVKVLCGHPLPVNPIATPKPDYRNRPITRYLFNHFLPRLSSQTTCVKS